MSPEFLSPPLVFTTYDGSNLDQFIYSSSITSESHESHDSGSDGDSGVSITETTPRPRFSRSSNPRSRNGCFTCRQRKVKCNEVRPKCGPCTRLDKECDWNYRWKFDDLSIRTQKKHKNVHVEGNPIWDRKAEQPQRRRKSPSNDKDSFAFAELIHDGDREERAISKPAGTYNVILTQESFHRIPQNGKIVKKQGRDRKRGSPSKDGGHTGSSSSSSDEDPDVIFLSDFEDATFSAALATSGSMSPSRRKSPVEFTAQVSCISTVPRDITDYGHLDQGKFTLHYSDFVTKRIMPLGSRFGFGGNEDLVVAESKKFRPLHHAICAISMLSVALKGQRNLLAGAYQHYHQAISACMTCTDATQGQLLYLHFILLIYDIVCATQNGAKDEQMVGQHLQHLSRIAYQGNGEKMEELQAYVLWYVLFLDGSSCLAGNKTSGAFSRAYLVNNSTLPHWRNKQTVHQKTALKDDYGVFTTVHILSKFMCNEAVHLSQLALQLRDEAEKGLSSVAARQKMISDFDNEMRRGWASKYPMSLQKDSAQAGERLPVLAKTVFEFALLQHSTSFVYLHTSMYPNQRLHSCLNSKEVSRHCTLILEMATATVAAQNFDQHHFVYAIFLAGYASLEQREKMLAVELLRAMKGTGISQNVIHSRKLLELVCLEQQARMKAGGCPEEVDWIDFAKENGMGFVNFGL